jgi:hypothetical protein
MTAPESPRHEPQPLIQSHPPERRRKKSIVLCGCCCTCCCCCCLHSIGGALGSSLVNSHIDVPDWVSLDATDKKSITGRPIYQIILLTLTALIVFGTHVYVFIDRNPSLNEWGGILAVEVVVLLLAFPILQLAAAVLAIVGAAIFAKPQLKGLYYRSLLRIMGGIVVGSLIGLVFTVGALALIIASFK